MREYFCAYHSMLGAMRKLSDAECGRLFRALLTYSSGQEPDNLQGREELLFDVFAQQIDRDMDKYKKTCETNKANGKKAVGSDRQRSVAVGCGRTQEKEKEEYISPYNPPTGDDEDELLAISARHQEVFDKAKACGFTANTADLDRLTELISVYGPDSVLDALDACVESQAVNFRYLRAVLGRKPKEQPSQPQYQRLFP